MMDKNKEEEKSLSKGKRVSCAENGLIAEQYTQNGWFVKIKPIFSLDKKNEFAYNRPTILFSFVEKGKKGAGFDIYMDMDVFDLWADDVLDITRTFAKTIEAESNSGEKYPKTYKYVTGTNGEKSVGFCKSTINGAFASINGCTVKDGKKVFANVPVDLNWIRSCMKWYRRITAPYFAMMAELTRQHLVSEWYKPQDDDVEEYSPNHTQEAAESPQNDASFQNTPDCATNSIKPVNEANTKPHANNDYKCIEVVTSTLMQTYGKNGNFCFKAFTKDNKEIPFVIIPSEIDQAYADSLKRFQAQATKATKIKTSLYYIQVKDRNLVKGIA